MKNLKKTMCAALCGLALGLLMAGCADILRTPEAPEAKPGRITLTIGGGPERTAVPGIDQFGKISLVIEGQDGSADLGDVVAVGGSAAVVFPEYGSWKITAKAYLNDSDTNPAAISEAHDFSWDGISVDGDTRFILAPAGNGNGTLKYTITIQNGVTLAGSGSRIRIELDGVALDGYAGDAHPISGDTAEAESLAAGTYAVDILLENSGGEIAAYRESVLILPGLITEIGFAPDPEDFLDPEAWAALTDIWDEDLEFGLTLANLNGIFVDSLGGSAASPALSIDAPAKTETVRFTLAKTAAHSVAIGGADAAFVTQAEPGAFVEASEAGDELAIFEVDASGIVDAGGTKTFTITVAEAGRTGVPVAVTVTVPEPLPDPGLYINTGGAEENLVLLTDGDGNPVTGPDLESCLNWLEVKANLVNNTEYVILVDRDSEMLTSFVTPSDLSGSSGIRITLRGLGQERKIYTNLTNFTAVGGSPSLFGIYTGVTLSLDNNITVGAVDGYQDLNGNQLFTPWSGALEMLPGSKISGNKNGRMVYVRGLFSMKDGTTIENNQCNTQVVYVYYEKSTFEMEEGAKIVNNTLSFTASASMPTNVASVIRVSAGAVFTMRGGEIINNSWRGVYVDGGSSAFTMSGGVIKNNGNVPVNYSDTDYYPYGAGIYLGQYAQFTMTGGEISGNGHSSYPGSGIYNGAKYQGESSVNKGFLALNGSVKISDTIMFRANNASQYYYLEIGNSFDPDGAIAVDLCINATESTDFASWWLGKNILRSWSSAPVTISTSGFASLFTVKCWLTGAYPATDISETFHYKVGDNGYIAVTE